MDSKAKKQFSGKRVLIFQQRGWARRIGHPLARELKKEGAEIGAYTLKKSTDRWVRKQKDVDYTFLVHHDDIMIDPRGYLGDDNYSLGEIARELDIDSIWPIAATLRNHVKSYGEKFYYAFRQNVPDEEIVLYIQAVYKLTKKTFEEFGPDIILTPNFTEPVHIITSLYAKKHGAKMLAISDSKVRGVWLFVNDYNETPESLPARIKEVEGGEKSKNKERARAYIKEFRNRHVTPDYMDKVLAKPTFTQRIRNELKPYRAILRWYKKKPIDYLPNLGVMKDYRPPRIILRDHYTKKRYKKFADSFDYYSLEKVGKYVYFPLQVQPEAVTDVMAPFFSNQLEMARLSAMSLPGDYTLVVKDHPAFAGLRPPSHLEKFARTPNVKLVDYRIQSEKVLKGADVVISPNSTTLSEAAFYNTPAIQFGNQGTTLLFPNVFQHKCMATLSEKVREVLAKDLHTAEYERALENYVAAAYDVGIEFNYIGLWEQAEKVDMEKLWQFYKRELIRNFK